MVKPIQQDYTTNITLQRESKRLGLPLNYCWFKDTLKNISKNGGYIINLANEGDPGTHWTILYKEGSNYAWFDPFGAVPPLVVQEKLPKYLYNATVIQNPSKGFCGSYSIEFLQYMHENKHIPFRQRFQNFLNMFSDNFHKNEKILRKLEKN
jgi:hypothetical protein